MCHKSVAHPPFFNEKLQMRNEIGEKGGFLGGNEVF